MRATLIQTRQEGRGLLGVPLWEAADLRTRDALGHFAAESFGSLTRRNVTTGNQVVCSAQAEAQIDRETAANMRPRRAEVLHHLARRPGFLQGVRQNRRDDAGPARRWGSWRQSS